MKDQEIFEQLERLGAAFPWEEVSVNIRRAPAGVFSFWVHLQGDQQLGLNWDCASGNTIADAVEQIIRKNPDRDPEKSRLKKIRELQMQIAKIQAKGPLTLPPFRPCLLLGVSNPSTEDRPAPERPPAPEYVNVESRREEPPF